MTVNPQLIKEITDLTEEWYVVINRDHHKTKDCFFYINTVWQFGEPPKYRVEHYGYIVDNIIAEFDTYEQAAEFLKNTLETMVEEQKAQIEEEENLDLL